MPLHDLQGERRPSYVDCIHTSCYFFRHLRDKRLGLIVVVETNTILLKYDEPERRWRASQDTHINIA
jgi:hypothetical protein